MELSKAKGKSYLNVLATSPSCVKVLEKYQSFLSIDNGVAAVLVMWVLESYQSYMCVSTGVLQVIPVSRYWSPTTPTCV